MTDYVICGWRVRSALPLPEAASWRGADHPVDIEIRPGSLPAMADMSKYFKATQDGRVFLDLSPVVRFLVAPNSIVVDTSHAPEAPEWRVRLLGPALGVLCYLRGVVPLHACSIRIGERTIAIAGPSCAGKSTLAAALMRRNHVLVTDDICAITLVRGRPTVLPSFPALKLSSDSLNTLGIDPNGLIHVWLDTDKFLVPTTDGFDPTPVSLDAVYLLEDASERNELAIIPISGADAFERLNEVYYRDEMGRLLRPPSTWFAMAAQLAHHVAVRRLVRRTEFDNLTALVRLIEADASDQNDRDSPRPRSN